MQEKRNKRLLILLLVLSSATFAAYWWGRDGDNFEVDKDTFKNFDLNAINEIILESNTDTVTLKFDGSRWKVNDLFNTDPDMIQVLFATLQQAEPKRPLASSLQDSVAKNLQQNGVKVSLFTPDALQKTFYAGGNALKKQAFFMDGDGGVPYIMTIPGYHVYVSGIFELTENGWRNKLVFGFNWRNFQRLEVNFHQKSTDDFVVAMDDSYFGVQGLTEVDTTKLNDFLDNVSLLKAEEYITPNASLDSLAKAGPFVSIVVKDIARNEYALQLYPPLGKSRQTPGLMNGTQWALFHENTILEIVHPRNFFGK